MTTAPNSGFYLYPSAVFHGLAVHEFASCAYLLFKRLSDDFKVIKTPLFYLSCLALIANVIDLVAYSLALQFLIIPKSLAEYSSPYYVRVLNMCVFAYQIPQLFNHAVILLRILGVHEQKSGQFLFLAFLAISHLLVVLIAWFYGYIATQRFDFYSSPAYNTFIVFSGMAVVFDALLNVFGAVVFLRVIGKALQMSGGQLFREVIINHDGFRWFIVIGLNIFMTYSVVSGVLYGGGSDVVSTAYHVGPFNNFLTLYVFLECSYVAAKDILLKHTTAHSNSRFSSK